MLCITANECVKGILYIYLCVTVCVHVSQYMACLCIAVLSCVISYVGKSLKVGCGREGEKRGGFTLYQLSK